MKQSKSLKTEKLALHKLNPIDKSQPKKRVGRGIGSKRGKTSTAGHKGQRARSGHKIGFAFEGGQMPFYRRIPKVRGFKAINPIKYQVVNLQQIAIKKLTNITPETLYTSGLIRNPKQFVKILGVGKITEKLTFQVHALSDSAKEKILAASGKITLLKR